MRLEHINFNCLLSGNQKKPASIYQHTFLFVIVHKRMTHVALAKFTRSYSNLEYLCMVQLYVLLAGQKLKGSMESRVI